MSTMNDTPVRLVVNTTQSAFDAMCLHLASMITRSAVDQHCRYRGPNGQRCPVGAILPDGAATNALDAVMNSDGQTGMTVTWLSDNHYVDGGIVDLILLREVQAIHDSEESWFEGGGLTTGAWDRIIDYGKRRGVDVSVPTAITQRLLA